MPQYTIKASQLTTVTWRTRTIVIAECWLGLCTHCHGGNDVSMVGRHAWYLHLYPQLHTQTQTQTHSYRCMRRKEKKINPIIPKAPLLVHFPRKTLQFHFPIFSPHSQILQLARTTAQASAPIISSATPWASADWVAKGDSSPNRSEDYDSITNQALNSKLFSYLNNTPLSLSLSPFHLEHQ